MAILMSPRFFTCPLSRWRRVSAFSVAFLLLVLRSTAPSLAADASGQAPDALTFRQLSSDVNSSEPRVRRAALKALATMGPEALDPISLLVADPLRDIRHDAILAIVAIYVEPPPKRRVSICGRVIRRLLRSAV